MTRWRQGRWDCLSSGCGAGTPGIPRGSGPAGAASAAELCGEDPDAPSLGRPRGGVSSRSRDGVTEPQTFADSRGPGGPQPGSGRGVHLRWRRHLRSRPGSGRAFVPEVPLRRETSLKKRTWTGDAAPARRPGRRLTLAVPTWGGKMWTRPRLPLRPVKPSQLAAPPVLPAHLGSSSLDPGPRGLPTSRCLSHRSPLRSVDCTAAPEGQTKFGFGKRSRGQGWKFCSGAQTAGSRVSLVVPRAWPRSTIRTHPVGGVRTAIP